MVCHVSFKKLKLFLVWQCIHLALFFFTFKWIQCLSKVLDWQSFGETSVHPSNEDSMPAAWAASTFRQVELSKKENSHSCQCHLTVSLTPGSHEMGCFGCDSHLTCLPMLSWGTPANLGININLPLSLVQGKSLKN